MERLQTSLVSPKVCKFRRKGLTPYSTTMGADDVGNLTFFIYEERKFPYLEGLSYNFYRSKKN